MDVLMVGDDPTLLHTRAAVLRSIGLNPIECFRVDLADSMEGKQVKLVLLCHSIRVDCRLPVLTKIMSRWPDAKIIQVEKLTFHGRSAARDTGVVSGDPSDLVPYLRRLLANTADAVDPGGCPIAEIAASVPKTDAN